MENINIQNGEFAFVVDKGCIKSIITLLLSDKKNFEKRYKNITKDEFLKYKDRNDVINIKESDGFIKQSNGSWDVSKVYSFDVLSKEALELYQILLKIIDGDYNALYDMIVKKQERDNNISRFEQEIFDKLDSIDEVDEKKEELSELKKYVEKYKHHKEHNINKYYELLYDTLSIDYFEEKHIQKN